MKQIIDFKPAKIHRGKDFYIFYSIKLPGDAAFIFVRKRINNIAVGERKRYAEKCVAEINDALFNYQDPRQKIITKQNILFSEAIKQALQIAINKKLRPATLKDYRSQYNRLAAWVSGRAPHIKYVNNFTGADAICFFDYLLSTGVGPYTYNTFITNLRTLFNNFIDRDYIDKNPFKVVKPLKVEEKTRTILTPAQLSQIDNAFSHLPHYLVVCYLCLYCFIRRTEITRLRIEHINFERHTIELPGSATKNRKRRIVVIPDVFYALLMQLNYSGFPGHYFIAGTGADFKPGSMPSSAKRITDKFRITVQRLGMDTGKIKFYSLKDTGITLFSERNSLKAAQMQAGHANIEQTGIYYHLTPDAVTGLRKFRIF